MKKLTIVIMACVIAFSSLLLPVRASEVTNPVQISREFNRDYVIELALQIFPEYADTISGNTPVNPNIPYGGSGDKVVIYETRNISDDDYIIYQEYASGRAFIFVISGGYMLESETSYPSYTDYVVDLHAFCTFSENTFLIHDFKYRYTNNGVDSILSRGTCGGDVVFSAYDTYCLTENGGANPYANYLANFSVEVSAGENYSYTGVYNAYITVTVNNGNVSIQGS